LIYYLLVLLVVCLSGARDLFSHLFEKLNNEALDNFLLVDAQ